MEYGNWEILENQRSVMKVTHGWIMESFVTDEKGYTTSSLVYIPDENHDMEKYWKMKIMIWKNIGND